MKQELIQKQKMPEGWKRMSLGEIGSFLRGPFGSSVQKSVCVVKGKDTYKLYEQGNVINNDFQIRDYYLTKEKFLELEKFEIKPDDILMTCAGTLGKIAIVPEGIEKGIINSVLMRIRLNQSLILNKYFIYLFKSPTFQNKVISQSSGAGIKNLFATKELKKFEIILPPLPVQHQIVAKLNAQMAQIGIMKKEAEKEKEASEEIKPSYLSKMFESISGECSSKSISEICHRPQYGYTASSTIDKVGPKMLRITDIQDGDVIWDNVPYCLCSDEDYKKYELQNNDIVFARTGATTGKSFLIKNPKNSIFASYLIRLKIANKEVLPDYLYLFFQSQVYWNAILKDSRGGIMPNFNAEMLSKLKIPTPSKSIQEKFIKEAKILTKYNFVIIEHINHKLSAISQLQSSILNEVFGKCQKPSVKD